MYTFMVRNNQSFGVSICYISSFCISCYVVEMNGDSAITDMSTLRIYFQGDFACARAADKIWSRKIGGSTAYLIY